MKTTKGKAQGFKKIIIALFAVIMIMTSAMPAFAKTGDNSKKGYSVPATFTLRVGESKKLTVSGPRGAKVSVCYQYAGNLVKTSKNVKFDANGKASITFTGIKEGSFDAYAHINNDSGNRTTYSGISVKCRVTVTKKNGSGTGSSSSKKIALQRINLNKTSANVNVGNTLQLSVSYTPSNTTDSKSVTWSSSNTGVATVSGGKVTAKKPGTATITAKVGSKTVTCKITVKAPLKSISLNKTTASLTAGQTLSLSVSFNPGNTTDSKTVTWSSSNTGVATVSGGKVTAKKAGTATITAKAGGKTATCKVTVKAAANNNTSSTSGSSASAGAADGTYKNVSEGYTLLNTFRTTASNQWYWNASNTAKVSAGNLKPLQRDIVLENIAKERAKEQWTMYYERGRLTHDRPNGQSCWTAYSAGSNPCGENLAWGHRTCQQAIVDPSGWAETNEKYGGQGHRRNMLSGSATRVGIACYEKDGKTCWAMCLGY